MFKFKYKNKFDYSVCYATYSFPCSFVARVSSKKPILFVHNDYMSFYNNNVKQYKEFFYNLQVFEYQKIIFVSNYDKAVFDIKMHEFANKTMFINNLIDYKKIINKSNEKVDDFKESKEIIFINIGRHDEKQKKLSRIIAATKKLNRDKYKFRVVFIGAGIDDEKYSKYDIKKLMITSPNTKSGTIDFGYRILKIFGNKEKKIYTLIISKNSEFKNSGKDEDYETFYEEIVKFCIVNGIEYELV